MCNQNYLQLVAGETVKTAKVVVKWPRKGWFGWFLGQKMIVTLEVKKDNHSGLCLVAHRPGMKPVWILHRYIFAQDCPSWFDGEQKDLWKVVRKLLKEEIVLFLKQREAELEASRQQSSVEVENLARPVLPQDSAISTLPTPLPPGLRLVSSAPATSGYLPLVRRHLARQDKSVGFLKLPSLEGYVILYRVKVEKEFELHLIEVSRQSPLWLHLEIAKKVGHSVSVRLGVDELIPKEDQASCLLADYIKKSFLEEPGQSKVAR